MYMYTCAWFDRDRGREEVSRGCIKGAGEEGGVCWVEGGEGEGCEEGVWDAEAVVGVSVRVGRWVLWLLNG